MQTPGPGRADARRNREAILHAALDLAARSSEVSMAEVARAAGVTRVTIYRHFADRDALIDALIELMATSAVPAVLADLESLPLPEAFDALARSVVTAAEQHRRLLLAVGHRVEQVTRSAIADEPILSILRRKRETGELVSELSDGWLARGIRALCMAAVTDERPPDAVATDLSWSLQRLAL